MNTINQTLKQYYGYSSFRPGQQGIIEAIMEGRDVLGIMPTGGGKSLCYQIPAVEMPGLTLVISPLISLMKDQVDGLVTMGIKAGYLNSQLTLDEQNQTIREAIGNELDLLYVSPERLENEYFLSRLRQMHINLIAVDEAHCISQWGHDFRPSYQAIPAVRDHCRNRPPFAAFTATATQKVREDIIQRLDLQDPYAFTASFDRPNLTFSIAHPKNKQQKLLELIKKNESSVIYCNTRKNVERVYSFLKKKGYDAGYYHGGLSAEERTRYQEDFLYDKTPVIVATNAFGMGIDKSNVRYVIHYNMPLDMESYYQEAGRAGRDGAPAEAVLFYSSQDIITNNMLIEQGSHPHAKKNLNTIISYCKTGQCLRKVILAYFDETAQSDVCGNCSNCNGETERIEVTETCQKILSCIYRMNQQFGMGMITDVLRGKNNARIRSQRFDELSTYGIMKAASDQTIKDTIALMVSEQFLQVGGDQYPILKFTDKTVDLLHAREKLYMIKHQETEQKTKAAVNEDYDQALFEELRALRKAIAGEIGKPPFVVFTDRSLMSMAAVYPKTPADLLTVHGVGEAKLDKYGEAFLERIGEYLANKEDS
ncbi:ATP-dependent DNA helicase RecQ [Alkalibacterium sp. AK22]|uniref:DNA helicase RecQ n=1 Tax=Alkalibacterium sp. AK22 TaxID=1229520 RepID=UPI00044883CE|nr:DNA helicase RecQ [Alkalibacterium sp. AK22]EXJ23991.1 ATP-dependent DNA helicase RecQ [Alkalibacterium sp. AK22]